MVDREGRLGWGSSARFELSAKLVAMLKEGKELADVIDEVSGKSDVRSNEGAMGIVTNGNLSVPPPPTCHWMGTISHSPFHPLPAEGRGLLARGLVCVRSLHLTTQVLGMSAFSAFCVLSVKFQTDSVETRGRADVDLDWEIWVGGKGGWEFQCASWRRYTDPSPACGSFPLLTLDQKAEQPSP